MGDIRTFQLYLTTVMRSNELVAAAQGTLRADTAEIASAQRAVSTLNVTNFRATLREYEQLLDLAVPISPPSTIFGLHFEQDVRVYPHILPLWPDLHFCIVARDERVLARGFTSLGVRTIGREPWHWTYDDELQSGSSPTQFDGWNDSLDYVCVDAEQDGRQYLAQFDFSLLQSYKPHLARQPT